MDIGHTGWQPGGAKGPKGGKGGKSPKGGGKKGKAQQQPKGSKGGKTWDGGKGKKGSKGYTPPPQPNPQWSQGGQQNFSGECHFCGKAGHKWSDCRKRLNNRGNAAVSIEPSNSQQTTAASSHASEVGVSVSQVGQQQQPSTIASIREDGTWGRNWDFDGRTVCHIASDTLGAKQEDESFVRVVETESEALKALEIRQLVYNQVTSAGDWFYVLYDSGADEHCCPPGFAASLGVSGKGEGILRDVSGNVISQGRWRTVPFEIYQNDETAVQAKASTVVANITRRCCP